MEEKLAALLLAFGQQYAKSPESPEVYKTIIDLIRDNLHSDKWLLFVKWFFKNHYDSGFWPTYNDWANALAVYLYGTPEFAWSEVCRLTADGRPYGSFADVVVSAFGSETPMRQAGLDDLDRLQRKFVAAWGVYCRGRLK